MSLLSGIPAFSVRSISSTGRKFTLSNSWHSSAAIIVAMQATITNSHFVVAIANLGSKNFETS